MQNKISKGMVLSGIFSSEHIDRTGERIIVSGMDVSHLQGPNAVVNYEHKSDSPSSILGRVISCKKIFKDEDCKNKFEKQCFESVNKVPFIMGSVELWSDPEDNHDEARALAGIIKSYKRKNLPLPIAFSIEGASIEKNGPEIKRSVAKTVALTFRPANESCTLDQLELSKSEKVMYEKFQKTSDIKNPKVLSVGPFDTINVVDSIDVQATLNDLGAKLQKLTKALEAGFAMGGPGTLTQGAALQGKKPVTKEESSSSSTTEVSETLIKPIDHDKVEEVDENGKELELKKIKLKKAEVFVLKTLTSLKKAK